MSNLAQSILKLRRDPRILKLPPYLSALCVIIGVTWLLLLPLEDYSRKTYISENALLPGQVHTYFGGSEHSVFRAYRHEIAALYRQPGSVVAQSIGDIFKSQGLKVARQKYNYTSAGRTVQGENVYGVLRGPRADATEAIVLVAAWRNINEELNQSGVALVVTLARYFKRWSLWSKDIFFLITEDSKAGPQAWVDAYHDAHSKGLIESLAIKGGALQGAVVVDYTAGPAGRRFDKLHVFYDGVNGQLANLDLFNTVVNIASTQVGIGVTIQRMWHHSNTYKERLETIFRGMISQSVGQASGPHSSFIPYHVDALTLQTVGDGPHDEISLGRVLEGTTRSLNNLLEHLHQSFFFYLLMQPDRFVSIGTYLPSAMLIAVNFAITSIALWVASGRTVAPVKPINTESHTSGKGTIEKIDSGDAVVPVPKDIPSTAERKLFLPISFIVTVHFLGVFALQVFNHISEQYFSTAFVFTALISMAIPHVSAATLSTFNPLTLQETQLLTCFSALLLSMSLATLSTINFSLSLLLGLLAAPLSFVRPLQGPETRRFPDTKAVHWSILVKPKIALSILQSLALLAITPTTILAAIAYAQRDPDPLFAFSNTGPIEIALRSTSDRIVELLAQVAFGYNVSGTWTMLVVWMVWWPNWVIGAVVGSPLLKLRRG